MMVGDQVYPDKKALVRTDTNKIIGAHGQGYKVLLNDDVVNSMEEAIKSSNLSNDYDIFVDVFEDGRRMQGKVIFNDMLVEIDDSTQKDDHIRFEAQFYNSYDGSWAYQQSAVAQRLWCLNGCTTPDSVAKTWMKHTAQISVEGNTKKLEKGFEIFGNNKDVWSDYTQQKVSLKNAERFIRNHVVQQYKTHSVIKDKDAKVNERQFEALMKQTHEEFSQLGATKWALYNALTHWASHVPDASKAPEKLRLHRDRQIAKAMTTKAWATV